MSAFTPVSGLIGGGLIGLAAATLLLGNGDILGASGICSSFIITPRKTLTESSQQWKLSFVAGFLLSVKVYVSYIDPNALIDPALGTNPNLPIVSPLGHIVSGFLVGFGTRLGNGCTSGHGICGLARLSKRSLVAVCSFMASGMLTASACSPTCPLAPYLRAGPEGVAIPTAATSFVGSVLTSLAVGVAIPSILRPAPKVDKESKDAEREALNRDREINNSRKLGPAALSGSLFALGLIISQMTKSFKIYGFLDLKGFGRGTWDGTLAFVMIGGLVISFAAYQWVSGHGVFKNDRALACPLMQKKTVGQFSVPTNKTIDANLVFGSAIFGFGWGIGGLCPGPALALAAAGFPHLLYRWWPSFLVGTFLSQKLKDHQASK